MSREDGRLRSWLGAMVSLVVAAAAPGTVAAAELPALGTAARDAMLARPACREGFLPLATGSGPSAMRTDGLVVVRGGRILFEHYDPEWDATKPHTLWSASKSVTATLLGAAIQAGARLPSGEPVEPGLPVARVFPAQQRPGRDPNAANYGLLRLSHLIAMTAGFEWSENYEADPTRSSFLPMLYLEGRGDMARYALTRPMVAEAPGERWIYSGGNSNIVMAVLRAAYGPRYASLPWELLFRPLGMAEGRAGPVWERDGAGNFVGSSYVYMTPRDMARLGLLYLRDGVWEGRRILPEGWVAQARRPVAAQANDRLGAEYLRYVDEEGPYSEGSFWLNLELPGRRVQFPNAPRDMFLAAGHYGQMIVILPSQDMVIARTGHDAEYWSRIDAFVSTAVRCFAGRGDG